MMTFAYFGSIMLARALIATSRAGRTSGQHRTYIEPLGSHLPILLNESGCNFIFDLRDGRAVFEVLAIWFYENNETIKSSLPFYMRFEAILPDICVTHRDS